LLEQCSAINIRRCGINSSDTANSTDLVSAVVTGLANLHKGIADRLPPGNAKTEQLRILDLYRKEELRINMLFSVSSKDHIQCR
jgi:hypothetical protein